MKFALLVLATAICLNSTHIAVSQETKQTADETKKTADDPKSVFLKIQKQLQKSDLENAHKLMTKKAADQFAVDLIFLSSQLAQDSMMGGMGGDMPEKLRAVNEKYGLDDIDIPMSFFNPMDPPDEEEKSAMQKKVLAPLDKNGKRFAALKEIMKAAGEIAIGANPFEGKLVEQEIKGNLATLKIELMPPEGMMENIEIQEDEFDTDDFPGGEEGFPEGVQVEFMAPPMFLSFKKTDKGWRWNGIDEEKQQEAMEEFQEMLGDMDFDAGMMMEPMENIPDFKLTGETAGGKKVDLADFKGKVVLVDFWGTWCKGCIAEFPALKKLYKALNEKGFEIIGVALDDKKTLEKFAKKTPLPWTNIVDAKGKISDKYEIRMFPTTLLIDQKGNHVKSNLHGNKLLDELIKLLKLKDEDVKDLRKELKKLDRSMPMPPMKTDGKSDHVDATSRAGFKFADANSDSKISASELTEYLNVRVPDDLPYKKIFEKLDADGSGQVSKNEFANRHEVIMHFMGDDFFGQMNAPAPTDPGEKFVLFRGLDAEVDDRGIMGAVYHRHYDATDKPSDAWPNVDLESVPNSTQKTDVEMADANSRPAKTSLENLIKATLVVAGGDQEFFTAGAVVVSPTGIALTNYHVAEAMKHSKLTAMTPDGKVHRIVEFIAGNRQRDVALVQLDGDKEFDFVKIADQCPNVGDDIVLIHHSENRFFTYDRGYVMRHPRVGNDTWMEISSDYAPGGSGCGIFNKNHEVIGLVSLVMYGDGPSIAEPLPDEETDWQSEKMEWSDEEPNGSEAGMLLVKRAVSFSAIHSLLKGNPMPNATKSTSRPAFQPSQSQQTYTRFPHHFSKY